MVEDSSSSKRSILILLRRNQLGWILIFSVAVPVVIGLIDSGGEFKYEPLLLGLVLALLGSVVDLIIEVQRLRADQAALMESHWRARNRSDERLIEVREVSNNLWAEGNRLLAKFFNKGLLDLRDEIAAAHGAGRYRGMPTRQTRKWLLDFSNGAHVKVTHSLFDNDRVFGGDEAWRSFHRDLGERVKDGRILGVRRIFVLEDKRDANNRVLRAQLELHEKTVGYEYRLLFRRRFEEIKRHHEFESNEEDFGIYGQYVYQWPHRAALQPGEFIFSRQRVKNYQKLYDACWEQAWRDIDGMIKSDSQRIH